MVPSPSISDYASLLQNVDPNTAFVYQQELYVQSLRSKFVFSNLTFFRDVPYSLLLCD